MKFTILSHACIYIEYLDTRLLIDPWVIGSCYWRSWWNYPEPDPNLIDKIQPTHIYITHLHWDHYHGPSLRKFEKFQPVIIFPKHFNKRMVGDCKRDFKFKDIIEIDHGRNFYIGKDFKITSYQFNPFCIDSSLAIEANKVSMLNTNDSKVYGLSLNQILSNHKSFDFVFRSHSSASPLPHCVKGSNPMSSDRSPQDYVNEFIRFSRKTKARYAVPFASSHCYLHPKTKKYNKFYSNPGYVKEIYDSHNFSDQECVIMPSGSSWSNTNGFNLIKHDYSLIDQDIKEYLSQKKEILDLQTTKEKEQRLNKRSFHKYFSNFLKKTKFPFSISFNFGFLIDEKKSNTLYLCIVNGKRNSTNIEIIGSEDEIFNYKLNFIIKTPIYVFNDCNIKKMFNTFSASKLLEIIPLSKNTFKDFAKLSLLLDFYENDCLPIYRLLSIRNLIIMIRRWRELLDIFIYLFLIKLMKNNIASLYT